MIGSGLKKLAAANSMTVSNGVAYGALRGYVATLSEGSGYKLLVLSTSFADPVKKTEFLDRISQFGKKQLQKDFRVTNLEVEANSIGVVFQDTVGTMKKIEAFIDWFFPLLDEYVAAKADVCALCGMQIADGCWVMVDGVCHHVHDACAEKIGRDIASDNEQEKQERTGSYLSGAVGAFLGSALGAIVWAVVLLMGYVASIVGLLIGWLAEKGYSLLKGKVGKAKVVILILAVIFGVLLGTVAADAFTLIGMINGGELPGATLADIPLIILVTFVESPEYLTGTLTNVGLGLLFAALGVFGIMRKAGKEAAGTKFVKLN